MVSIAVTGAAGAVGSRVVECLRHTDGVHRVVAIDRVPPRRPRRRPPVDDAVDDAIDGDGDRDREAGTADVSVEVERHAVDLLSATPELFEGCDSVVHLAEDGARRADGRLAGSVLDRVLDTADEVGCNHAVLLSSALVYGAYPDNPVPITEDQRRRPIAELSHAVIKAAMEERVATWAERSGTEAAVLRPTATLSEGDSSWIGAALRAATTVRSDGVDPPVQFLHHDDLAAAVALAARDRLDGAFNVAPDGWIGAEAFRDLRGETSVRLPEQVADWPLRMAKTLANRSLLDGLEPYVRHPWVVSNDRMRRAGWQPAFSNEEAFVAGTPRPIFTSIGPQRRQELALGVVGAAGMAAAGTALWLARRVVR